MWFFFLISVNCDDFNIFLKDCLVYSLSFCQIISLFFVNIYVICVFFKSSILIFFYLGECGGKNVIKLNMSRC